MQELFDQTIPFDPAADFAAFLKKAPVILREQLPALWRHVIEIRFDHLGSGTENVVVILARIEACAFERRITGRYLVKAGRNLISC